MHQGTRYLVETRARVIFFDMAAFEADKSLQRSSSVIHSAEHPPRNVSREHSGLMSWPDNFFKPRQHKPNHEDDDHEQMNLSARAMQLSKFGSMVGSLLLLIKKVVKDLLGDNIGSGKSIYFFH